MQRTLINLAVDLATALAMFGMILTGYVVRFPLPPGTNKEWMLWGLTRHEWGGIHFWISTILSALIVAHVCLHWKWIVTVVRQRMGLIKPSRYGVVPDALMVAFVLGVFFGGFAWIAHFGVERVPESHRADCSQEPIALPEPKSTKEEPTLTWNDVYPILERACLSCHGPQKQRANFRVDQVETLLNSSGKSPWVIPGKSNESPLVEIVSGRREIALPSRHRLPGADLNRLRQWIDAGAALSVRERAH